MSTYPGPAAQPPVKRRRKTLTRLTIALGVVLVLMAGGVFGAYRYYTSRLTRVSIRLPGATASTVGGVAAAVAPADEQNFVIAGSDTRAFAGGSAFQAPAGSPDVVTGQRSDTVMLVHLPAGDGRPTVVSFPRDALVQIPEYTDASRVVHTSYSAKLNEAFSVGGPALLVQLVEKLSGMHIDHYVQVDFSGFRQIVDALGGVTLCVSSNRYDQDSGDMLRAGTHPDVSGQTALGFVRDRKGLPRGDLDRITDQQYFLGQVLHKATSAGVLSNPLKVNSFLQAASADVTVDDTFGLPQLTALAGRLRHLDAAHVTFATIPITNPDATQPIHGVNQSVVLLDPAADAAFWGAIRTPPAGAPPAPGGTPAPTRAAMTAGDVTLSVYNGTRQPDLASRVSTQLRATGFTVSHVGNAPGGSQTVIRYPPGLQAAAQTVAQAVPVAALIPDATVGAVQLIVGDNFSSVTTTSPGPVPATTPAPTASPTCAP